MEVEKWKTRIDKMKTGPELHLRVEAIFLYDARQEDELSFSVGDIIIVSQIQPDGKRIKKKIMKFA